MASDLQSIRPPPWQPLRRRTLVALGLLAVALPVAAWTYSRERPDDWPARATLMVPERVYPVAVSPDGRTLLTSGLGGITPWDFETGVRGTPWESKEGFFAPEGTYSPDSRTFAAVISHHPKLASIELIDSGAGKTRTTLDTRHPKVFHVAFDPDGRTLRASLGDSHSLKETVTWDVETGQQTSSRPIGAVTNRNTTAISPEGRWLAFIPMRSPSIQLWDLEGDQALAGLPKIPGGVNGGSAMAFSADGRTLASSRDDGAIDLWDVPARKHLKTLPAHPRNYTSWRIWLSPDGRTLASTAFPIGPKSNLAQAFENLSRNFLGSDPGLPPELVVMDLATGRRLVRTTSSMFLFYSANGRSIVTRDNDLIVKIRDLPASPP